MNIVICGFGRAARALVRRILDTKDFNLEMIICRKESKNANRNVSDITGWKDAEHFYITPIDDAVKLLGKKSIDVVIDFSHHEMVFRSINLCGALGCNLVICTTNHKQDEIERFRRLAEEKNIGIAYCPNLTLGINLLIDFAHRLASMYTDFSFEIVEKHPADKIKPTTTATIIKNAIGNIEVPIHSLRINGYVGEHQVIGSNGTERITLIHESLSREAFANGAIIAAKFIKEKKGFFSMKHILNEYFT